MICVCVFNEYFTTVYVMQICVNVMSPLFYV